MSGSKRLFDIAFSTLLLIALSPVMAVVACIVRITIGTPVLFRQVRPGLNGKQFVMLKFRTMTDATDADGNTLSDEQRLTSLGQFLRASSIDELPGLINVLRGEMSFVGPRPLLVEYLPLYSDRQLRRHEVRPGITGWAQVNGRNAIGWEKKFELDVWYVENRTFVLDLRILWMTIWRVLRRDGISADDHATMPIFRGKSDAR